MDKEITAILSQISDEEQRILDGDETVRRDLYTENMEFIIDSEKLLSSGRLIDVRTHTRFIDFPMHSHNYSEMLYMVSGRLTTTIEGTGDVTLREGDLLMLSRNARHSIKKCGKNDVCVNFIILPEFFSRPAAMLGRRNVLSDFIMATMSGSVTPAPFLLFHTRGVLPLENLLENLVWNLVIRQHGVNTMNQVTLGLLLMNLSEYSDRIHAGQGNEKQQVLMQVLDYLDQNYAAGTLAECARNTGYTPYYLSRLLTAYTGKNFKQLLQQRRLQQAVYYLENTTLPTDTIIELIGYQNSSHFYNKFREQYGCTPKEYRIRR